MHRYVTALAMLLGAIGALTAGSDLWTFADEWTGFRSAETERRDLLSGLEQAQRRNAVSDDIAISLCENRITMHEAIRAIGAFAESSPDWLTRLRTVYHSHGSISPTATDHDVLVRYLRARIESLIRTAKVLGDPHRVAVLSARLARFDQEAHGPPHSPPAPYSHR